MRVFNRIFAGSAHLSGVCDRLGNCFSFATGPVVILIAYTTRVRASREVFQVSEEIRSELLVDLQEHILKVGHGDTVGLNLVLFQPLVEHLEEAAEVLRL